MRSIQHDPTGVIVPVGPYAQAVGANSFIVAERLETDEPVELEAIAVA